MVGQPLGSTEAVLVCFDTGSNTILNVSSGNPLPVDATLTGSVTIGNIAKANAADPSLAEDGTYPVSVDLSGHQRVKDVAVLTQLTTLTDNFDNVSGSEYETVAASQTAQVLGPTGATGDYIAQLLVIPASTSPGQVILLDGPTSITVFTGGASSVSNLVPFSIQLGMTSVSGAWKVTTGASVSVIGVGNFT